MLLRLLNFENVNWNRIAYIGLGILVLLLLFYARMAEINLQKADVVYKNPMIITQTRYIRIQGPIREVTRTVIKEGETRIEKVYVQGPSVESNEGWTLSQPLAGVAEEKPKRWFVGGGATGLGSDEKAGMFYGGVTLFDRFDLGAGVMTDKKLLVLGSYRF